MVYKTSAVATPNCKIDIHVFSLRPMGRCWGIWASSPGRCKGKCYPSPPDGPALMRHRRAARLEFNFLVAGWVYDGKLAREHLNALFLSHSLCSFPCPHPSSTTEAEHLHFLSKHATYCWHGKYGIVSKGSAYINQSRCNAYLHCKTKQRTWVSQVSLLSAIVEESYHANVME